MGGKALFPAPPASLSLSTPPFPFHARPAPLPRLRQVVRLRGRRVRPLHAEVPARRQEAPHLRRPRVRRGPRHRRRQDRARRPAEEARAVRTAGHRNGGEPVTSLPVRPMAPSDFPFAVALTDTERWGFTVDGFERFLALSSEGCFVVEHEGERAGLLTTCLYGEVGWIGNVIVTQRLRGLGLGAGLGRHANEDLERAGARAQRLWAYENTTALYAKFGFADDGLRSRRWIGFGHDKHEEPLARGPEGCSIYP